jgi:SWI/SNF-related matrix-associated actin-dependent regulator of chromatin subfamily A member 5
MNFHCPQHDCHDCERSTGNAGGLIYRCRWCHKGYCEDCLDPDSTLLGESLPEYAVLDYAPKRNAWYIHCTECKESQEDPEFGKLIASMAEQHDREYAELLQAQNDNVTQNTLPGASEIPPSRDESMTDGITLESSGQATPLDFARQGKRPMEYVDLVDDDTDHVVDLTGEGASKFLPISIDEETETSAGAPMYNKSRSKTKKRRTH